MPNTYLQDFETLKQVYSQKQPSVDIPQTQLQLLTFPFASQSTERLFAQQAPILSKNFNQLVCTHNIKTDSKLYEISLLPDIEIHHNSQFHYHLIRHKNIEKSAKVIILFHGLNEKDWTKYLPWAKTLAQNTGACVALFPIAFHIDRAVPAWQQPRPMSILSQERTTFFENIESSSFINVALSMRLHIAPNRFFLSGLQTYQDVIDWVYEIKKDRIPCIKANADVDFVGFSAGAFLALILMMANRDELFSHSKGILFCGGSLLTGMQLNSKYIMDNAAYQAILDFYTHNFDGVLAEDPILRQIMEQAKIGGTYFKSMLHDNNAAMTALRLNRLAALQKQIACVAFKNDEIIPPEAIQQTFGDTQINFKVADFMHEHSHMIPFSNNPKIATEVTQSYHEVFDWISHFLSH